MGNACCPSSSSPPSFDYVKIAFELPANEHEKRMIIFREEISGWGYLTQRQPGQDCIELWAADEEEKAEILKRIAESNLTAEQKTLLRVVLRPQFFTAEY